MVLPHYILVDKLVLVIWKFSTFSTYGVFYNTPILRGRPPDDKLDNERYCERRKQIVCTCRSNSKLCSLLSNFQKFSKNSSNQLPNLLRANLNVRVQCVNNCCLENNF